MKDQSTIRKYSWVGVLVVAAVLLFAWRMHQPKARRRRSRAPAAARNRRRCRGSGARRRADLSPRPWNRTSLLHGDRHGTGFDLLAQIDPRPNQAAYEQALAAKAKDEAQVVNAKRDLDRYLLLQHQDLASKQTVDTQRAMVDQLGAQLQGDQAVSDNAHTQLEYTRITSPIDGRTGLRLVDPGNIVHTAATTGIVVVTQVQPISVIFTLPEEDLPAISAALAVGAVQVTTLSRDGNSELDQGTLALVDNQIDQATGTAKLKAIFANAHNTFWPGQFVNARVLLRTARNVLTLPTTAVQLGPNGPFTYVVKSDSTVEVRALKIGDESAGLTVVNSGLALNERVVTSNQYRLQAGTHVLVNAATAVNGAAQGPAAAHRHLAADGRHFPGKPGRVPVVAGRAPAAGRLPHHFGECFVAGGEPRNHGRLGGNAARISVRGNIRADADDVHQRPWHQSDHPAIRSESQHRRGRAGRTDRH